MKAEQIRKISVYGGDAAASEIAEFLREIAAQLAELNQRLDDVIDAGAGSYPGYIRVRDENR